ncbi:unnamed protein product [Chondrus crispus]|uniref:Uncharacterized protein n=1 Tax=Chondrus crispus TaxID=2769 RepID=S0F3K8_CHOCR|nr:unnamed protein product [Chondrus crispus]CDF77494.1 unnamed protein product [Chondrus crispus]|eukprot:XP_005712533.1 unnamed protein product [Chondrus crispus]
MLSALRGRTISQVLLFRGLKRRSMNVAHTQTVASSYSASPWPLAGVDAHFRFRDTRY